MTTSDDQLHLDVLNEAMHRIGGPAGGAIIESFDEGAEGVPDTRRRYDTIINNLYGRHNWTWLVTLVQLTREAEAPAAGYAYTFVSPQPGDIRAVYRTSKAKTPFHDYRKIDGKVHADELALWAEVRTGSYPDRWPDYFRTLAVTALAWEFCVPVGGDMKLANELKAEAFGPPHEFPHGGLLRAAKQLDGQEEAGGQLSFGPDPITSARYS